MTKRVTDREKIVPLWQEAFGDSAENIEFFLDNARACKCFGCFDGERLVSMLFLVECTLYSQKAQYIYAACTEEESKGKGFMTELLSFVKNNVKRLCLIPADDGLVNYYSARGFDKKAGIDAISFNQTDEIKEYLFEGYSLTEPAALYYER